MKPKDLLAKMQADDLAQRNVPSERIESTLAQLESVLVSYAGYSLIEDIRSRTPELVGASLRDKYVRVYLV